jgi:hypothetical protein
MNKLTITNENGDLINPEDLLEDKNFENQPDSLPITNQNVNLQKNYLHLVNLLYNLKDKSNVYKVLRRDPI